MNRTPRKPITSVSGSRSAARIGGSTALTIATIAATTTAPQNVGMSTCGTSAAATSRATADTSHESTSRVGRSFGASGVQVGRSP